ncbi:MAG: metal ABC transporter substrate-binding protein [Phycisphaerales bacterium]
MSVLLAATLASAGCRGADDSAATSSADERTGTSVGGGSVATDRPRIVVSAAPLADLARRIAADLPFDIDLVPSTGPGRDDLRSVIAADLIVLHGAGHETWASTANLPRSRTLVVADGHREAWVLSPGSRSHGHGPGGPGTARAPIPETWFAPELAADAALSISEALGKRWPEHARALSENASRLTDQLAEIEATLADAGSRLGGRPVLLAADPAMYLTRGPQWRTSSVAISRGDSWTDADAAAVEAGLDLTMDAAAEAPETQRGPGAAGLLPEARPGEASRPRGLILFTGPITPERAKRIREQHGLVPVVVPASGDGRWLDRFAEGVDALAAAARSMSSPADGGAQPAARSGGTSPRNAIRPRPRPT